MTKSEEKPANQEIETEIPTTSTTIRSTTDSKLIDKINNHHSRYGRPFFSLEFFPPRNEKELTNFWPMLTRLKEGNPLFMDITWHERSSNDTNEQLTSLAIAGKSISTLNHETVLHMTCYGCDEATLESHLNRAKSLGVKNILALRGDRPASNEITESNCINQENMGNEAKNNQNNHETKKKSLGFTCALEMVRFIRDKFGDYFTIGVAGYPNGHPDAASYSDDLNYLKSKIDAGADFVITQLAFTAEEYIVFIENCRSIGITVPIIPGIFPIQTKTALRSISKLTKVEAPKEVVEAIKSCQGDEVKIKEYGVSQTVELCRKLIAAQIAPGLHFYTLNRDSGVIEVLKHLGLWSNQGSENNIANKVKQSDANCLKVADGKSQTNIESEIITLNGDFR